MRRTLEEELRKSLEITEEALRRANGEIESLALANQTLAASDRAHMAKIEQLQREVDLYTDILRSICGLLELPHSESGPCDGVGYYTRAIEGLQVDLAKTEAERAEHATARYKAEAEAERLKGLLAGLGAEPHCWFMEAEDGQNSAGPFDTQEQAEAWRKESAIHSPRYETWKPIPLYRAKQLEGGRKQ
jgi:hypothetical protein